MVAFSIFGQFPAIFSKFGVITRIKASCTPNQPHPPHVPYGMYASPGCKTLQNPLKRGWPKITGWSMLVAEYLFLDTAYPL
mmetsp:Transcript_106999/g.184554  ORF Transcript_106999/g.184554 Transcript_106999/m.184554 type:complete len:81 (-) Transcript_106999:759-1001(-)